MKRKLFVAMLAISSYAALLSCTQLAVAQTSGTTSGTDSETAASSDQSTQSPTPGTSSSTQDQATEPADAGTSDVFAEPTPPPPSSSQIDSTNQPPAPGGAATTPPQDQTLQQQQQQTNLDDDARQKQQQRDLMAGIQFGQATGRGLTVATVAEGSIFFDSGLRAGDVIVAYRDQPIRSEADFSRWAIFQAGQRVPVTVLRGDSEQIIYFTFPQDATDQAGRYQANRPELHSGGPAFLGVGFDTQLVNVAAVRDVLPGSAAEQAGLREGDVIVALNGEPISSFREAMSLIGSLRAGESLEIEYTRRVPNRAQAVLGVRPTSGPGAVAALPGEEVRVYRGGPGYDAPPIEGQYVEPPSEPVGESDSANELP